MEGQEEEATLSLRTRLLIPAVIVCFGAVAPAAASGAVRYAEPNGNGPEPCPQGNPCGLGQAVDDAAAGDEVVLAPGTYFREATLSVDTGARVRGPGAGTRPRIVSSALDGVVLSAPGARLLDVEVVHTGDGSAVRVERGALAERIFARTTGDEQTTAACAPSRGTIRDSVCWNSETGAGVRMACDGSCSDGSDVVNVTAVAELGAGVVVDADGGAVLRLAVKNSILQGEAGSVAPMFDYARGADAQSRAELLFSYSNYAGGISGGAGFTSNLGGGNQTDQPEFVNAATGDFHQRATSPTIDAGAPDALLGSRDVDGQLRTQDGAPDIGADEFPDTAAPQTEITGAPKRRVKTRKRRKRAKFGFESSEAGSSFECRLDGADEFAPCESPLKERVEAGGGKGRKHRLLVRAVDSVGNEDPTPAKHKWRVKRKRRG